MLWMKSLLFFCRFCLVLVGSAVSEFLVILFLGSEYGLENFVSDIWNKCLVRLEGELSSQDLSTWIRPLQAEVAEDRLVLMAPNRFVKDWVEDKYQGLLRGILRQVAPEMKVLDITVGHFVPEQKPSADNPSKKDSASTAAGRRPSVNSFGGKKKSTQLNPNFTFDNFIEGRSNQLSRVAAMQISDNNGDLYNPLLLYGGVGLGKTHLMHACGNKILENNPEKRVAYLHSEQFVNEMVTALQHKTINSFKDYYRSLDVLLVDDIQFFAGKGRTQEEFFHIFNALIEGRQQVVMTSDKYPNDINGLEDRLKSRFGWGLTVAIESPELETRVAILLSKAAENGVKLGQDVAFFIADKIHSNVRELEGALNRVTATANFTGEAVTIATAREALKDIFASHERQVSLQDIRTKVAEYYSIRESDLVSKSRKRMFARPRQIAMSLSKKLTNHSLPEIGESFGGRDHTTVIHACSKVQELVAVDEAIADDYKKLHRSLVG